MKSLIRWGGKSQRNIRGKRIAGLVLSFLAVSFLYQQVNFPKCMGYELDREQNFMVTHFLMMGLSEERNGVYDQKDVDYSASFTDRAARQEANRTVIKERIQEYGVGGMVEHLAKKTLTNYNDGTFAWGGEGEFFREELEKPEEILSQTLKNLYYNNGRYRAGLDTYMQFFLIVTLFGGLFNVLTLFDKKKSSEASLAIMLSLVGIFLFVSLFEARARYLYIYAPFYILIGIQGYKTSFDRRKKK